MSLMEQSCVPLVTDGVRPRKIPQEKEICASLERPREGDRRLRAIAQGTSGDA
jgi:hypothetical protein